MSRLREPGPSTVRLALGTKEAKKLKAREDARDEAAEERRNAAKDCAEERAADPDFGKCVRGGQVMRRGPA